MPPRYDHWIHPPEALQRWPHAACDNPKPDRRAAGEEVKRLRGAATKKDPWLIRGQLAGCDLPEGERVKVAVVGYIEEGPKTPPRAWGYLASSGHWGLGARVIPRWASADDDEIGAEGRALFWGLRNVFPRERNPVTLITDYPEIADMVQAWRNGRLDVLPAGYRTRHPDSGRTPKLILVSRAIAEYPNLIEVRLVDSYTATRWGKGANKLGQIAWDWSTRQIDKKTAAERAVPVAAHWLKVPPVLLPPEHERGRAARQLPPAQQPGNPDNPADHH